ncbi:hypothetical protein Taro_039799 [Colocasia esculenta]|uniref:Retrotransposon gag domain-containing protein n=1 Tax=Colocasia esculenta TaxID=4460 RepID=A0A843WA81_COLES|nr:hypothetical protein [Colocasia esculenta]
MAAERAQLRDMQQTIQQLTQALLQAVGDGGNRGAGDLHRNFRNLNPPRFNGTIDSDEVENWLKEIERIFRVMQCADGDKLLLATFQLERDARAWWESVEATKDDAQFTWEEFKEHFNSKYFSERVQESKTSEFTALKQRHLTVAEYEVQFSQLARYANHLVSTEKMKARRFLNGLKPSYITQLAPLDIWTYAEMVKKVQLLEDETDLTDRIKGRLVKKEPASGSSSKPTNGKKWSFNITRESNQERKPKIPTPPNTNKTNCEHCDKPEALLTLLEGNSPDRTQNLANSITGESNVAVECGIRLWQSNMAFDCSSRMQHSTVAVECSEFILHKVKIHPENSRGGLSSKSACQ